MEPSPETLAAFSQTLSATVSPDAATRRAAEESLRRAEAQPGFLLLVLQLVNSSSVDMVVRQTGGVYFKNAVKRLWSGEEVRGRMVRVRALAHTLQEVQISPADKTAIKAQLVPVMISLGTPATARLQSQVGEALSTIASQDFPDEWTGLVDVRTNLRTLSHPLASAYAR